MTPDNAPRVISPALLTGFYLILDESWATRCSLLEVLCQAGKAGIKLVQYRNKAGTMRQVYREAHTLRRVAAERAMAFIVNDRCDLALAVEADGVHLGQTDLPIRLARKVVGDQMCIGISTHNPEQVRMATKEGADYLGFGPIFSTGTKVNHDLVVGIEGMSDVRGLTTLPIFAIGGITSDAVPALRAAGANGVVVASAILDTVDRPSMFAQFTAHFQ